MRTGLDKPARLTIRVLWFLFLIVSLFVKSEVKANRETVPLSRPGRTLVGHRSLDRMMAGRIGACLHGEPLLHASVCEPV